MSPIKERKNARKHPLHCRYKYSESKLFILTVRFKEQGDMSDYITLLVRK
jgi:hypothetical protein